MKAKVLVLALCAVLLAGAVAGCASAPTLKQVDPFEAAYVGVVALVTFEPALKPTVLGIITMAEGQIDDNALQAVQYIMNQVAPLSPYAPLAVAGLVLVFDNLEQAKLKPEVVAQFKLLISRLKMTLGA